MSRRRGQGRAPALRLIDWVPGALGLSGVALALLGLFGPIGPLPLDRLEASAPENLEQAARLNEHLIARRPADASPWLRRAYIDRQRRASLSVSAQTDVLRSYELEPLGPELTRWRLTFLFENWDALSPALRNKAMDELGAIFPRHGWALRDLPSAVQNPQGRMAAFMAFSRFRTETNLNGATRHRSKMPPEHIST